MNPTEESYIIAYLHGKLAAAEAEAADRRRKEDAAFAQAVEETRLLMEVAHQSRMADMQSRVAAARAEAEAQPRTRRGRPWRILGAVAAVAAVLVFAVNWLLRPTSIDEIVHEAFEPMPSGHTLGGGTLNEAYQAYQGEKPDYARATELFAKVPPEDKEHGTAQLYLGNCQLALHRYHDAVLTLEALYNGPRPIPMEEDVRWYLALAYLGDGQVVAGEGLLKEIVARPRDTYHDRAARVLGRLG